PSRRRPRSLLLYATPSRSGRRRHIAQMHHIQVGDVDTKLHRGRAEHHLQIAAAEALFAFLTVILRDLTSMLAPFQVAQVAGRARSEEHTSELESREKLVCR